MRGASVRRKTTHTHKKAQPTILQCVLTRLPRPRPPPPSSQKTIARDDLSHRRVQFVRAPGGGLHARLWYVTAWFCVVPPHTRFGVASVLGATRNIGKSTKWGEKTHQTPAPTTQQKKQLHIVLRRKNAHTRAQGVYALLVSDVWADSACVAFEKSATRVARLMRPSRVCVSRNYERGLLMWVIRVVHHTTCVCVCVWRRCWCLAAPQPPQLV